MARLAEIKEAATNEEGQPAGTVHVNPANVISVAPITGGARIVLSEGQVIQTALGVAEVVKLIQEAML